MAFIRGKRKKDSVYYYIVESKRVDGKVRQKVLAYLGQCPTVDEAIEYWTGRLDEWKLEAERLTKAVEGSRYDGKPFEHRRYARLTRSEIRYKYDFEALQQAKKYVWEVTERLGRIREVSARL